MKFKEWVMKIVKVWYEIEKSWLSEVWIWVADNIYKVFEEKLDSYFLWEKNDDGERGYHSFWMYSSYVFNEFISANIGMVNPLVTDIDKDIFFDLAQYHWHICEDY